MWNRSMLNGMYIFKSDSILYVVFLKDTLYFQNELYLL